MPGQRAELDLRVFLGIYTKLWGQAGPNFALSFLKVPYALYRLPLLDGESLLDSCSIRGERIRKIVAHGPRPDHKTSNLSSKK
jgi:hypothetical protein